MLGAADRPERVARSTPIPPPVREPLSDRPGRTWYDRIMLIATVIGALAGVIALGR